MDTNQTRIDELLAHPSESLNVEIKRWIDPRTAVGSSKIARATMALRNRNGGFLIIGFDDKTLKPMRYEFNEDRKSLFHVDTVQLIVSRFANDIFEIAVHFGFTAGEEYPVIYVPPGVTAPVAAKRDLKDEDSRSLIAIGDVYFRTLAANGVPSSAKAKPDDWKSILEICFENREADIGRFLRRHLGGTRRDEFIDAITGVDQPSLKEQAFASLDDGQRRAKEAFSHKKSDEVPPEEAGTWSVALVLDQQHAGALPTRDFLQKVAGANPQFTGWPIWLDSQNFRDRRSHPIVRDDAWEASISSSHGWSSHFDFMRFDPSGKFYLWRVLEDDLTDKVSPCTALDKNIVLLRVSEAITVGIAISKACGWPSETKLGFAFEWAGLQNRQIASWANASYSIYRGGHSQVNVVRTYVEVPCDTAASAIAPYLEQATRSLFVVFEGLELPHSKYEEWARRLVERDFGR